MAVLEYSDVKAFFLKAMKHHPFINGIDADKSKIHPGFETFEFEDGAFKLVDTWYPGNYCSGYTMIWHNGKPAWMMTFGGKYPGETLTTLRGALKEAYLTDSFIGGRGVRIHTNGVLTYINIVPSGDDFMRGEGEEIIVNTSSNEIIGYHKYFYQALGN